ncbi:hypothetical protein [Streptomyces sp. A5-4]|uniref:hypothetical protein n=1 Tax=Streptomyces sp. A5-4 TaxID=3384771 RepID=UPI003DAA19A8
MGVFARFRRKSKDAAEGAAEEGQAATLTADPAEETETESKEVAAEKTAEASEPAEPATAAESVEIPKQQSVEEAADNGAGESARK